jgi:hypothetical protein
MKMLAIFLCLFYSFQTLGARWNSANNPNNFRPILGTGVITQFDLLPLAGQLVDQRLGWSESYWPSNKGGIAYRWNHPDPRPFRFHLHSKEEIHQMSLGELSQLSPAELYDISQGDYEYTLTKKTLSMFSAGDLWWEGICHGWAQAAANYPEPAQVYVTNPDGIKIPFGSSDVKALLAMHDAYNSLGWYSMIGDRCHVRGKVPGEASERDGYGLMPSEEDAARPECADVNAGAFHVILANMIGVHSRGVVADVDRFNDVWNQPITSFASTIKEELIVEAAEKAYGVARKLRMMTIMTYGEELQFYSEEAFARGARNFVSKKPVTRTESQAFKNKYYEYILELDQSGQIIGGQWISLTRPDFLWIKKRDPQFLDGKLPLAGLKRIYHPIKP